MTLVHLLSDTVYPQQAVKQLHQLLDGANEFPVKAAQIYGLRQIARQEPKRIREFAKHQGQRAKSRYDAEDDRKNPRDSVLQSLQAEIDFWTLIDNLCNGTTFNWSVIQERDSHIPEDLQNRPDMSRRERRKLGECRDKWSEQWDNEHIPAFFERFCTYCLYCIAKAEMRQLGSINIDETDQLSQQEQNDSQDGGAMQTALQQANLVE